MSDRENDQQRDREEAIRQQVRDAIASRNASRQRTPAGNEDGPGQPPAGGGSLADQLRAIEAREGGMLVPILLGPSSSRGEAMLLWEFVLRQPLVPEKIFVALAFSSRTPHGTIRLSWYSRKAHHLELGEPPFSELLEIAGGNLKQGLGGEGYTTDHGPLLTLEREEYHAASAVALPDFYDKMSRQLGARRLIVGIACSEQMLIADADSGNADGVRGWTLEGGNDGDYLGPTVLLVEADRVEVLAERPV